MGSTKETLSDIIQRDVSEDKKAPVGLMKRIVHGCRRFHNKVCSDCDCSEPHQQRFVFRVVESNPTLRTFSRSRNRGEHPRRIVRLATMNVALFSLASALPVASTNMQSESEVFHNSTCNLNPAFSPNPFYSFHSSPCIEFGTPNNCVLDVLRDSKADLIALQEVRAEEEKDMSPLANLAMELGMYYAYAESWAPEFGNAILSRWPIKRSSMTRIYNSSDYRNLLKVAVDVPCLGEVIFCCTHLDHLDEDWRLKQVSAILDDTRKQPHFLLGDLNSLNRADYSNERWAEITKIRTENRKMAPRGDVMERLLVERGYLDACAVASAEIPALVRGQGIQGTCKHNTRVDYILGSSHLPYKFMPGSYKVVSSRGTSDHQLVMVDVAKKNQF